RPFSSGGEDCAWARTRRGVLALPVLGRKGGRDRATGWGGFHPRALAVTGDAAVSQIELLHPLRRPAAVRMLLERELLVLVSNPPERTARRNAHPPIRILPIEICQPLLHPLLHRRERFAAWRRWALGLNSHLGVDAENLRVNAGEAAAAGRAVEVAH